MEIRFLKSYIIDHDYIELILQSIGMHKIKWHDYKRYVSCAFPDGDNPSGCVVYNDENLHTEGFTRDIKDKNGLSDIISLVCFVENCSFSHGLNRICQIVGLDYYTDPEEDIPESLKITRLIYGMKQGIEELENEKPLKPIPEAILGYYKPYVNDMFKNDGISYTTQTEFEIGYDEETNHITIPIRSEIADLCGVKGRLFKEELDEFELKYIYLEPCGRSKILYGLYKTYPFIKSAGKCFVGESEKLVMQLWDMGVFNSVAIGGKKISRNQIEKLTRLGVDLIFVFDKDVTKEELECIADKFVKGVPIYYIFDTSNILGDKESPTDNISKWQELYKNCLFRLR